MADHARDHHHRHVAASLLAWPLEHACGWRRVDDHWFCNGGACKFTDHARHWFDGVRRGPSDFVLRKFVLRAQRWPRRCGRRRNF